MNFSKLALITLVLSANAITAHAQDSNDQDNQARTGGAYGEIGVISYDDDLSGLELKLGYSFNKYFGVETQGSIGTNREDRTESLPADLVALGAPESLTVDGKIDYSVAAFAVARLPITDKFQIFARGGLHNTQVSVEIEDGVIPDFNQTETGIAVGGGLQYNFSEKNGIRLDYTYLDDFDADTVSLAYVRRF